MGTQGAAMGAHPGSGPRTSSTGNLKGEDWGKRGEGEKAEKKKISCKIQLANIGPGRVRSWEHR